MLHSLVQSLMPLVATALALVVAVIGFDTVPAALAAMADTERAFARRAADTSIHAAFVEFFADEAVNFDPDPGPARERLRKQPNAFPKDLRMVWEPRMGDVAGSGDLGYLTGPVESTRPGQPVRHGTYFSVWKKQANGEYRVILDIGSSFPGKPEFPPSFVRSAAVAAYTGSDSRAAAEASLMAADKNLGATLAANGAATAYAAVLHPVARVHRPGHPSMTTRESATEWLRAHVTAMTSTPLKSETAASRDLGYTWGSWTATDASGKGTRGYYVRVWTRAADGAWHLAADVTEPSRATDGTQIGHE